MIISKIKAQAANNRKPFRDGPGLFFPVERRIIAAEYPFNYSLDYSFNYYPFNYLQAHAIGAADGEQEGKGQQQWR